MTNASDHASDLESLYRELVLDHHRRPRGRQPLEGPDIEVLRENPTCGDEVRVQLGRHGGALAEVAVLGRGCALSIASGSLMAEAVRGLMPGAAIELAARLRRLLEDSAAPAVGLGDLVALAGVRRFPVRLRCVLLPWEALEEAIRRLGWAASPGEDGSGEKEEGSPVRFPEEPPRRG